jgi:nucleolar protein 12
MKKALIRHVLTSPTLLALLPDSFPSLKADSIRFRSLAFASTVFGRKATAEGTAEEEAPVEPGGRGRKRARDWRDHDNMDERGVKGGFRQTEEERKAAARNGGGAQAGGPERKGALTDGQKRRVAFIRGELNEGKKACNAYLVVDNLPAGSSLTIAELMRLIVEATDGSLFEAFTLRADHVRPRSSAATLAAAQTLAKPSTNLIAPQLGGIAYTVPPIEARRTLFVGGLDFAESEENIRAATELVLVREKGPSGERGYVERVRIIRDASTGLGKGFGYVLLRVRFPLFFLSFPPSRTYHNHLSTGC